MTGRAALLVFAGALAAGALLLAVPADPLRLAAGEAKRIRALAGDAVTAGDARAAEVLAAVPARPAIAAPSAPARVVAEGSSWRIERDGAAPAYLPAARSWSLLPPLVAITAAVLTRHIVGSLALAAALSVLLAAPPGGWGVVTGPADIAAHVLGDTDHQWILAFGIMLIGMTHVMTASGGLAGLARALGRWARDAKRTELAAYFMGLAIFFDDYANTVVIGATMKPLCRARGVSMQKLAFIIDSTSAPVAGLALVSTWIGFEVGLIAEGLEGLDVSTSAYGVFLSALPYRFYCRAALGIVLLSIVTGRDFPLMARFQRAARTTAGSAAATVDAAPAAHERPIAAVVPALIVVLGTLVGLVLNGAGLVSPAGLHPEAWARFDGSRLVILQNHYIISAENDGFVLFVAATAGTAAAVFLGRFACGVPVGRLLFAWTDAFYTLAVPVMILLLSWTLGEAQSRLGMSTYVIASAAGDLPAWLVPAGIFVLAAIVSFSTGASWGTMVVLIPVSLPLAHHIGGVPLLIVTAGAVLDGAIFGDHCSPLSDTTILSALASDCTLMDHVRTQLPYALTAAAAALGAGYLVTAWAPPYTAELVGIPFMLLVLRRFGERPDDARPLA